jgi:membrane associated rhomboid family serine protease
MIVIASFGRAIRMQYGNKVVWALYLLGSLFGGLGMNFAMPYMPMVVPQVGSDAAVSAMLTFFGLLNLNQSILLFVFPVRMWVQ